MVTCSSSTLEKPSCKQVISPWILFFLYLYECLLKVLVFAFVFFSLHRWLNLYPCRLKMSSTHPRRLRLKIHVIILRLKPVKILFEDIPHDRLASAICRTSNHHGSTGKCFLILIWPSVKMIWIAMIGLVHKTIDTCCTWNYKYQYYQFIWRWWRHCRHC